MFGGRYDDPEGQYRVLYASSSRHGCFIETLARFRLSLAFLSELQAIEGDDDFVPLTEVDRGWFAQRLCGQAHTDARFADVFAIAWIAVLRVHFARPRHWESPTSMRRPSSTQRSTQEGAIG